MRAVLLLIVMTLGLTGCVTTGSRQAKLIPEGPVPILRTYNSEVGGPAHAGLYVINSQRGLMNAGLMRPDRIDVDFSTEIVLLYAMGEQEYRGYWTTIRAVSARDGAYVAQCRYNSPGGVPAKGRYRPFAVAIVPYSDITTARPSVLRSVGAPKPVNY